MMERSTAVEDQNSWVATRWLRTSRQQWRAAWAAIPAAAWQAWLVTMTIGWLIACGVVLGAIWLLNAPVMAGFRAYEPTLLQTIADTRLMEPASTNWMNIPGHPLYLAVIIAIVTLTAIRLGRLVEGASMVAGFLLVTVAVGVGWFLWARERPDLVLDGAFAPGLNSFPSGHTAQAVVVYGLLGYFWVRHTTRRSEKVVAIVLMGGAILVVAVGRLWIAAHWPSDVIVSLLIGAIMVWGLVRANERAAAALVPQ